MAKESTPGPTKIPEDDLRAELYRLRDDLNRIPTSIDMNEHGDYSVMPYVNTFGSWNDALRAVGFPVHSKEKATDEQLIEDYRRVADSLGRIPSKADLNEYGRWSAWTYHERLGSSDILAEQYLDIPRSPPDIEPPELE